MALGHAANAARGGPRATNSARRGLGPLRRMKVMMTSKRATRPRSLTELIGVRGRRAVATTNRFRGSGRSVAFPAYLATTRQDPGH